MIIPSSLKKGDTIAITCTAGYMPKKNAEACIKALEKEGYKVVISHTVGGNSKNYFSSTDEDRLAELQKYLDDKNVKAILCGRGGYGTSRIIDKINFSKFVAKPKWIIGFSDITILLNHITSNFNIATLHAPMSTAFRFKEHNPENIVSLFKSLRGEKNNYETIANKLNKTGKAKGKIVGGNIALLANAIGTSSDIKTKNCILFIEDIGEYLYAEDRMLQQLKRAGKFKDLAGLVVGTFTEMMDTKRKFGKDMNSNIAELVAEYNYPVCFEFPVGHSINNRTIKIGGQYTLECNEKNTILKEV